MCGAWRSRWVCGLVSLSPGTGGWFARLRRGGRGLGRGGLELWALCEVPGGGVGR